MPQIDTNYNHTNFLDQTKDSARNTIIQLYQ